MGWIRGFANESREDSNFFSRANIENITPIMKELVVIDDTCLRNGTIIYDPQEIYYRDCINYRSFFVGLDLWNTVNWKLVRLILNGPNVYILSFLELSILCVRNSGNPNEGASLKDLSKGWRWDDGQEVEQNHWKNKCLNEPYEPILRNRASIFQSYPDKKLM